MKVSSCSRCACHAVLISLALSSVPVLAQTEVIFQPIGMDNQLVFPHTSLPGATGIDFSFFGGFAPAYPMDESHTVVINFEWGPTATGPWTVSPDYVNSVPGAMSDFFSTGVFPGPDDAPFVAIHFYAGGIMTVSGVFSHISVPEPQSLSLLLCAVASLSAVRRKRRHR